MNREWRGKYWTNWGEAQQEAGFAPATFLTEPVFSADDLVRRCAILTRKLGHFPREVDHIMAKTTDPTFPTMNVFKKRLGKSKLERAAMVRAYAKGSGGFDDVAAICDEELESAVASPTQGGDTDEIGYVYLIRSGKNYKIGRSNSASRREYEIGLKMPEDIRLVHRISTDDPVGIEAYWHKRFAAKRKNGEWFSLDGVDIAAFRRRKFM